MNIEIRGAREHNLRSIDLSIPSAALTVVCGVSGSGKSTLLFDVLHAEGQRRYLEALALDARVDLPAPPRVDSIDGLPPTIALGQRTGAASPRATVGSVGEVAPLLRVLWARAGTRHCPACGRAITPVSIDEATASLMRLPEGSRLHLETPVRARDGVLEEIGRAGFGRVRLDGEVVRVEDIDASRIARAKTLRVVVDRIRVEAKRRERLADSLRLAFRAGGGVVVAAHDAGEDVFVDRPWCDHDQRAFPALDPEALDPRRIGGCAACGGSAVAGDAPCAACDGTGLSDDARAVRWRGRPFGDVVHGDAVAVTTTLDGLPATTEVERVTVAELRRRLARMTELGVGHLGLSRPAPTLSTTELRRLRLARAVAAPLSGVAYLLDEPAAGLDDAAAARVVGVLRELVAAGNTVVVVEHHPSVLRAADHLIEFGPGAGAVGGEVVFRGTPDALAAADTRTGRHLAGKTAAPAGARDPGTSRATLSGPWCQGRPSVDLSLPRGRLVVVTGPSGSGKSAAIGAVARCLAGSPPPGVMLVGADGLTRLVAADRLAGRSARGVVASYLGTWDVLRDLLSQTKDAQVRALTAASFSIATPGGRCESCKGTGERWIDLGPLPEVVETCPVCAGSRFQADVLEVRWRGAHAAELLAMDADRALPLLAGHPKLDASLRALVRAGLGYLPLGRSLATLSGGEARRLAIARELARAARRGGDDVLVLLDDPTVGLHPDDVLVLLTLLRELRDEGSTIWVGSVDPLLVAAADAVERLSR